MSRLDGGAPAEVGPMHGENSHRRRFAEEVVSSAGILDDETSAVLTRAFAVVPREMFLAEHFHVRALQDVSLPIGYSQHMTRPSIVARMLGLIGLRPKMRILEIGCGSGYVSAVMAAAGAQVYSYERIGFLANQCRKTLDGLGYQSVLVRMGDGSRGWPEHAPFDAIIVWIPFENVDKELISQLEPDGGKMVAVVGVGHTQTLSLWESHGDKAVMYQLETGRFID